MKAKVPTNAEPGLADFGRRLLDELDIEFQKRTPDGNSRQDLLLTSPDGSIWSVTVSDAGALSATKVHG